jgi:hypothetical protein
METDEKKLELVKDDNRLPALREVGMPAVPGEQIGAIKLDEKERAVLDRPAEMGRIMVRPDPQQNGSAVLYLSHDWYRDRLREALGFGAFGIKTIKIWGEEQDGGKSVLIYVWAALYVRGCFVGDAIGSHKYFPANKQMDYSDAVKAAKSNAFVRCCTDAGLGIETYQRKFCEQFIAEHCIEVIVKEDGKLVPRWRRKDSPPFAGEQPVTAGAGQNSIKKEPSIFQTGSATAQPQPPPVATSTDTAETIIDLDATQRQLASEEQVQRLKELTLRLNPAAVAAALKARRVTTFEELSAKQAQNIIEKLEGATA